MDQATFSRQKQSLCSSIYLLGYKRSSLTSHILAVCLLKWIILANAIHFPSYIITTDLILSYSNHSKYFVYHWLKWASNIGSLRSFANYVFIVILYRFLRREGGRSRINPSQTSISCKYRITNECVERSWKIARSLWCVTSPFRLALPMNEPGDSTVVEKQGNGLSI